MAPVVDAVFPFVAAALAAGALTPLVRHVLRLRGFVDVPNRRSSHAAPVPTGVGVACILAVLAGCCAAQVVGVGGVPWALVLWAVAIGLVGVRDDRANLPPFVRLVAQAVVGAGMGLGEGTAGWVVLGVVSVPVFVNMVNFMDGINGITCATMTVWGVTVMAAGAAQESGRLALLGALAAGAAVGFLPWNFPVARVFMGDAGSYLFGGLVAAGLLVALSDEVRALTVLAPMTLYLADTGATLLRRGLRGDRLLEGHREHVYQRLTHECGLGHAATTVGVTLVAAALTLTVAMTPWPVGVGCMAVAAAVYLTAPTVVASTYQGGWSR